MRLSAEVRCSCNAIATVAAQEDAEADAIPFLRAVHSQIDEPRECAACGLDMTRVQIVISRGESISA